MAAEGTAPGSQGSGRDSRLQAPGRGARRCWTWVMDARGEKLQKTQPWGPVVQTFLRCIMSAKRLQPQGLITKRRLRWTQRPKSHLLHQRQRFTCCSSSAWSQLLWAALERSNAATQEICWVASGRWLCDNSHSFSFLHASLLMAALWLFCQALSPFLLQISQLQLNS